MPRIGELMKSHRKGGSNRVYEKRRRFGDWELLDSLGTLNDVDGFIEIAEIRTVALVGGTVVANAEGNNSTQLRGTAYVNYYVLKDHTVHERFAVNRSYRIPTSGSTNILDVLNDMKRKR